MNLPLDPETREGMRRYCDREGVPMTALFEAFARTTTSAEPPAWLGELVVEARRILVERKRRQLP